MEEAILWGAPVADRHLARRARYLTLQPRGTVPAYRDAYGREIGSWDIFPHLERIAPELRMLPTHAEAGARVERWVARADTELREVRHHLYWPCSEPPVSGPSRADVAVYAWSSNFRRYDLLSDRAPESPHLTAWWERLDTRPSVVASRNVKGRPFGEWLAEREGE